jgi:hypothetical protein
MQGYKESGNTFKELNKRRLKMENTKEIEKVDETKIEKAVKEFVPNPAFVSAGALLPRNYGDVMQVAAIMAKSGIVPSAMAGKPEACAVAIMFGLEIGLSPNQAVQNVMIVNGRASIWGDAVKALVMGSGKCELFDEDPHHIALKQGFGRCRLVRKKEFGGGEVEVQFSIEDAKRAKLWTKSGPWTDHPGRMLQVRARGWACRDLFPDTLKGMQMYEEVVDFQLLDREPVQMPRKAPRIVQDATVVENVAKPENGEIAQPTPQPTPAVGAVAVDSQVATDPNAKIDVKERKELFRMLGEAKIQLSDFKEYLKSVGIVSTASLTKATLDQVEVWIVKNAKA